MYTVLSIAGPKSKELMDEMTGTDMTMHPFTYREVNVGYASGVMVLAVTNTGKGALLFLINNFFFSENASLLHSIERETLILTDGLVLLLNVAVFQI